MSRPTKLTDEVHEKAVQLARAGMFLKDIAEFLGLAEQTIYNWLERGELEENRIELGREPTEGEERYVAFLGSIRQARAHANISDMNVIGQAALNDPYWAERRLKLRNPKLGQQQVNVNVRTPEQVAMQEKLEMFGRAERYVRGEEDSHGRAGNR